MAADLNKPTVASLKVGFPVEIVENGHVIATSFDGDPTATNKPTNATRIDASDSQVYKWNGSSWDSIGYIAVDRDAATSIIDGAPAALDTLNELAAALADDANFAATVTASLALKLDKSDNLAALSNKATSRTNLGVYGTTEVYQKSETYTKTEVDNIISSATDVGYSVLTGSGNYSNADAGQLQLILIGAGGGGGAGRNETGDTQDTGGAGGNSGHVRVYEMDILASTNYAYVSGAGGTGGIANAGDGSDGGDTVFDTGSLYLTANGGEGGNGGVGTTGGEPTEPTNMGYNVQGGRGGAGDPPPATYSKLGDAGGPIPGDIAVYFGDGGTGGVTAGSGGTGGGGAGCAIPFPIEGYDGANLGTGGAAGDASGGGAEGKDATGNGAGGGGGGPNADGGDGSDGFILYRFLG